MFYYIMDKFFIKDIQELSEGISVDELNHLFQDLLEQLQIFLGLLHIDLNAKIILKKFEKPKLFEKKNDFLDIGVIRYYKDILIIEIFDSYQKYFPFILLREAYYYFVPHSLKGNDMVKLFITQMVINDLEGLETSKSWILEFRHSFMDSEFIAAQFDKLDKFLKLKGTKQSIEPTIFFFEYIRNNVLLIQDKFEDFYEALFTEFFYKTSMSIHNDEMIEIIRILIKIFYKVKNFRSLEEYKKYFKEFKESGYIKTDFSLRKFVSNIKWLSKFSVIAPSYDTDSGMMGINTISCSFIFHPILERKEIDLISKNIPFFYQSMSSEKNFSIDIFGWAVFPSIYQKDFNRFIENLFQAGYLVDKHCILIYNKANRSSPRL